MCMINNILITVSAPWFDDVCNEKRRMFYNALNKYRDDKSNSNREYMVSARSTYKSVLRCARYNYDRNMTEKLIDARLSNAKEYWKLLKGCSNIPQHNIPLTDFMRYFKAVNSPDSQFCVPDEDVIHFNDRYLKGEMQVMFQNLTYQLAVMR